MFNQNGTFNGIDTCNAVLFGRFDYNSELLKESEARSLYNRPDIVQHMKKLRSEKIITKFTEKDKLEFASRFARYSDWQILNIHTYIRICRVV